MANVYDLIEQITSVIYKEGVITKQDIDVDVRETTVDKLYLMRFESDFYFIAESQVGKYMRRIKEYEGSFSALFDAYNNINAAIDNLGLGFVKDIVNKYELVSLVELIFEENILHDLDCDESWVPFVDIVDLNGNVLNVEDEEIYLIGEDIEGPISEDEFDKIDSTAYSPNIVSAVLTHKKTVVAVCFEDLGIEDPDTEYYYIPCKVVIKKDIQ